MFRSATVRLTVWYVLVLMGLSFLFSGLLYRSLTAELDSGLNRQAIYYRELPLAQGGIVDRLNQAKELHDQQLREAKRRIVLELLYLNLVLLAAGSLGSYALARRTLKPIEDAHDAQVRFTADASHELKTPLAAMKAELEVALRDKKLSIEESKDIHRSSLQEIAKLDALTGGLLKLAAQEGAGQAPRTIVKLDEIATEAVDRARSRFEAKGLELTLNLKPVSAKGDAWAVSEAVAILLDNAIKYTPAGGTITVGTGTEGGSPYVKVVDTGIGIRAADIPHLFDRFYRADTSRSKEQAEGYGLGLSIAKKIIDAHRGSIRVTSRPGKGSSFTLFLPGGRRLA